jgi:Family of unknown function (DUF6152)
VRATVINPHAMMALEERTKEGQVRRWTVEGPNLIRVKRMGVGEDFLKAGDEIEVCGFAPRKNAEKSFPPPRFIHGHVLVLPDGHRRLWGPYGKLGNCILPDNPPQLWLDFLNADPLALDAWCAGPDMSRFHR